MYVSYTPQQLLDLTSAYKEFLLNIFGTDIAYRYNDNGTIDLEIIGGDIDLSGTAKGKGTDNIQRMIKDRVNTRVLTANGESNLLPANYGSMVPTLVGKSSSSINSNLSDYAKALISFGLEDEGYVEEVLDVNVSISSDKSSLFVNIRYKPILFSKNAFSLQIRGD